MADDIITTSAGAPASDITPGVYEVTPTDISEPRTIYQQTGVNAGKEVQLRDCTFALEDGTEIMGSASTATDVATHVSPMSRLMTVARPEGFEPPTI